MSSTPYTSFALVGATGKIGKLILNAFNSKNIPVLVLTRSATDKTFPVGTQVEEVPGYDDVQAVTAVLQKHKVEVLIAAVALSALEVQIPLADAAKAAGVKLIVSSEFSFAGVKERYGEYFQSIGLPSLRLYIGLFSSALPILVSYHLNNKFNIIGDGNQPISFTEDTDIAGFLIHLLTTFPPSQLHDKIYRIEGDRITYAEAAQLYHAELVDVSKPGNEQVDIPDFIRYLLVRASDGTATSLYDAPNATFVETNDNDLWPGHQWKKMRDLVKV